MRLTDLTSQRVLIWGGAREGTATARQLQAQECHIAFISDEPDTDSHTRDAANLFNTNVIAPSAIDEWNPDFIVRSPGVSKYRPELSRHPSSSLFALWLADEDPHRIIGVTGTKGKSTTSSLIAEILRAAGHSVELAGNIGVPVTETSPFSDFVVVEVSSYQASDCSTSPHVGVLTSLDVDHLPWHGNIETYHRDKLNLFSHPQIQHMIYPSGSQRIDEWMVQLKLDSKRFDNARHSVHVALATPQGEQVLNRMGNTTFPHNLELAINAALAADNSLTLAHVLTALDNTTPLPSRQEIVATVNGFTFVDDALASNPLGVNAAIDRFDVGPFVLIMGGEERNVDYSDLCTSINDTQHLDGIVVLGDSSSRMYKALLSTKVQVRSANSDNVADAVAVALQMALLGSTIVFSPGAPTPRHLGDYSTRSAMFKDGISQLLP